MTRLDFAAVKDPLLTLLLLLLLLLPVGSPDIKDSGICMCVCIIQDTNITSGLFASKAQSTHIECVIRSTRVVSWRLLSFNDWEVVGRQNLRLTS